MRRLVSVILTMLMVLSTVQLVPAKGFEPTSLSATGSASALMTDVTVNGSAHQMLTYNIYSNYFYKLRDVASVLDGTEKEFSLSWDDKTQTVYVNAGESYEPSGTEMIGIIGEKPFTRSGAEFYVNGSETSLTSYIIDNEHYVKMYDISKKLNFQVDFVQPSALAVDTQKPYMGLAGEDIPVNYADSTSWYMLPENTDKAVDCFYILPTCWNKQNPNEPNFTQIDNPSLIAGADRAYNNGGIVFGEDCNMYVPYYRQLDATVRTDMSVAEQDAHMSELPVNDVVSAFDYYIKNYNNGRPFILAGHSQGSDVCRYILADYMKENPEVYKRMVAAYPIGYAVTADFMAANPHLKFAEGTSDTGVIISYNTEAEGYDLPSLVVRPNTLAINPISWTMDETPAVSELSSRLNVDGKYEEAAGVANAAVNKERGVINISGLDIDKYAPGNIVFPRGSLHGLDYPLYFNDIKKNVKNRIEKYFEKSGETTEFVYTPVDYSQKSSWALMPGTLDKAVDVFYAYPTAWFKPEGNSAPYADINSPVMVEGVKENIESRATAYAAAGNLFVPYYRQCDAVEALNMSADDMERLLLDGPVKDLTAAFDYYIKNINDGRPFILAGHSQGSNVLLYLLSDYMRENPEVQERMVAAYVIGYSVTEDYLAQNPHLAFAKGRTDTGVIISYNTEAPGLEAPNPVVNPGALVINPVTWTRSEEYAGKELSQGSNIDDGTGKYIKIEHYADAQVNKERGTLMCASIDPDEQEGNALFGRGIYHGLDYLLYYYDLTQNAIDRANAFLNR